MTALLHPIGCHVVVLVYINTIHTLHITDLTDVAEGSYTIQYKQTEDTLSRDELRCHYYHTFDHWYQGRVREKGKDV